MNRDTMELYDGHQLCPSCLGLVHLREVLTNPCMDCSIMSVAQRQARLTSLAGKEDDTVARPLHKEKKAVKRHSREETERPQKKRKSTHGLAQQVESLSSDMEQIKSLLLSLNKNPVKVLAEDTEL